LLSINRLNKTEALNYQPKLPLVNNAEVQSFSLLDQTDLLKIAEKERTEAFFQSEDPLQERLKALNEPKKLEELPDFSQTPFRIGLVVAQKETTFASAGAKLYQITANGKEEIMALNSETYKVKSENGQLVLSNSENKIIGIFAGKLTVEDGLLPVTINGKKYRGDLEIMINPKTPNTLNALNRVMLEDYLKGVVPSESPSSWPLESLKAQALAARTYSVANWNKNNAQGFDLAATVSDQVYNGLAVEKESTNQAVEETRNKVIFHQGRPINALFFSCSGGKTDSALAVWGVDLPYIQPVADFDQEAPRFKWQKTTSNSEIQNALNKLGVNVGAIKEITPISFTPAERVKEIKFSGTSGEAIVDANKFRFALGLNSTLWTVKASSEKRFSLIGFDFSPKNFTFTGGGWGHGLGMSQWGARQMASDGKNAEEIVKHFYTGVEVGELK